MWTLTGVLWSRSPRAEGLRGGEAWRAGGDAGRSRAAAGHELLSARSAATSVRPPTSRRPTGSPREGESVSLTCPVCPAGLVFRTSPCSTVTEELEPLDSLRRIFTTIWPRSSPAVSLKGTVYLIITACLYVCAAQLGDNIVLNVT